MQGIDLRSAEIEATQDYYTVLTRIVEAVNEDNFLQRAMIYELARLKLRRGWGGRRRVEIAPNNGDRKAWLDVAKSWSPSATCAR